MSNNYSNQLASIIEKLYIKSGCSGNEAKRLARNAVQYMKSERSTLEKDIPIRLIKGGTYKIKGYYLENSKLSDIRGASTIITEVQERFVPELLKQEVGFDCILYNGGGNLFAIVPADCNENLGNKLEEEAQKYLVTANTAYSLSEEIQLSVLLGKNYKAQVAATENSLNERKKSKLLYNAAPKSELIGKRIIDAEIKAVTLPKADTYCAHCKKRLSWYRYGEEYICGGCLHKAVVGVKQKRGYMADYENYVRSRDKDIQLSECSEIKDIDEEHIAVFYADGNNMGGIIQNIERLDEMMEFSDFVKETMPKIVYNSLYSRGIKNVEFTALGGDDVFILVPGKKAIRLAMDMIKKYNDAFAEKYSNSHSTLSVGICIAKPNTPIKVMLEAAEDELAKAKELVKKSGCSGSLSYVIFDSYEGVSDERRRWTLLPYSLEASNQIIRMAEMVEPKAKARLRNISEAFRNADSDREASFFLEYINAKSDEGIILENVDGYTLRDGFYKRLTDNDEETCCIWDDLIDLVEFGIE